MRPTGFGMTVRERIPAKRVMPAAVQGKLGRKARNPWITSFADSEAEKTRWKQSGRNALLERLFSNNRPPQSRVSEQKNPETKNPSVRATPACCGNCRNARCLYRSRTGIGSLFRFPRRADFQKCDTWATTRAALNPAARRRAAFRKESPRCPGAQYSI